MADKRTLAKVMSGEDLTRGEAGDAMSQLMLGEVHHGMMGAFLAAMQMKGVTGDELAGFAEVMRNHALRFDFKEDGLVDTCGTGGGIPSFNLSTGAAILAASAGAKVAKHGNRAVTSKCGSADVLEGMGVAIGGDFDEQAKRLKDTRLVFMFAPNHHPAVRHVAPVRKVMGVRTFFNLLGPLCNPAGARRQMVGVFEKESMQAMGEALMKLGVDHAFVVHGTDGMDEVSPCQATDYVEVKGGEISSGSWRPEDFGQGALDASELAGGETVRENAEILKEALTDVDSVKSQCLIPNTAVTLYLSGVASSVGEGAEMAREAVRSGKSASLLDKIGGGA